MDMNNTQAVSFLDSIEIQQKPFFRAAFLKDAAGCSRLYGPEVRLTFNGRAINSLWLHQPTRAALTLIDQTCATIVRVHLALDLLTDSASQGRQLQDHIVRHLMPHSKPREDVTWKRTTAYFGWHGGRGPGVSVAIYSDRTSKAIPGHACCHIEWRITGAAALKAAKLRQTSDLLTLKHDEFWAGAARLVQTPSSESLGGLWLRTFLTRSAAHSKRFPFGNWSPSNVLSSSREATKRRVGQLLLRSQYGREVGEVPVNNDFATWLRRRNVFGRQSLATLFRPLPNEWLLPPPANALWEDNCAISTT